MFGSISAYKMTFYMFEFVRFSYIREDSMKEIIGENLWMSLKAPDNLSSECVCKLFHYTNNVKKEKIADGCNLVFKLSRVDDFLDRNEGFQILEPYYHACGHLYESGVIDKVFYELLIDIKQKDLLDGFSGAWIMCFSKNGNSPYMKRRYAAGDGWIFGINLDQLYGACIDFPADYGSIGLYEVEYSFNKLFSVFKKSLKKYYELYKQVKNGDLMVKRDIVNWLCEYSLIYKSSDYKPEEEIRLVCKFSSDFTRWENHEDGIRFESFVNGYDAVVKMILDKKWLIYEAQNLDICLDTKLNKTIIHDYELRKVLSKKRD